MRAPPVCSHSEARHASSLRRRVRRQRSAKQGCFPKRSNSTRNDEWAISDEGESGPPVPPDAGTCALRHAQSLTTRTSCAQLASRSELLCCLIPPLLTGGRQDYQTSRRNLQDRFRTRAKTPQILAYVLTSSFVSLSLSLFIHFCTTSSLKPAESPPCFN